MDAALLAVVTVVLGVGGCLAYFLLANQVLDTIVCRPNGGTARRNVSRANNIRPWLFVTPALLAIGVYLVYPVCATLWYSLNAGAQGGMFVGLRNYQRMMAEPKFWEALRNNLLWLAVVPAASTALGLLAAQLTDRLPWGRFAKAMIFMPMAISFVGASVIFKLMYETRPVDQAQIGLLNAVWLQFDAGLGSEVWLQVIPAILILSAAGGAGFCAFRLVCPVSKRGPSLNDRVMAAFVVCLAAACCQLAYEVLTARLPFGEPQVWLTIPHWNGAFLMLIVIWMQTGFAMVILSAALRNIPQETIEAAVLDGATPTQLFFQIKVPLISRALLVVWTLITVMVLKVFDIVFTMTNGQWGTQVLANYMFENLFRANDLGIGSAAGMTIMALLTPILIWNVYTAYKDVR